MPEPTTAAVGLLFPREDKYATAEQAVLRQLRSGRLSDTNRGPAIRALEEAFADLTDTDFALAFNSGTSALHAALHATGAHPEAGIAVSPMTWISAITATLHAGSFPVFCDLEPDGVNLDPTALAAVASSCSAAVVTHAWGIPARMDALAQTAEPLALIEDASHAHGAVYRGLPVGSLGAAGCFSLQDAKSVSGGEGGILTTSNRGVYERALVLGHHPHRLQNELTLPDLLPLAQTGAAYKFRMPVLSAVIAREHLRTLPERARTAGANLAVLTDTLADHKAPIAVLHLSEGSRCGWYGTPLTITEPVRDPDTLHAAAIAAGIPLRPLYDDWVCSPLFQQPGLLQRVWPHVRLTPYTPPDPDALPNYYRARHQTLVIKVPTVAAADYMHAVGQALVEVLVRHLNP
ncbi:DegT/DnrJ/EryC1/StrS family aminotransferase [Streptomyces fulvoviolaceus]|uniref:DegT/DnrJ/EryC1/StrS family aminotransferase n=1 Tax=Streptomyces fulvoviolaceus TaxID=285535 RepID=UPI0021BE9B69|nr:DegT/DnrJ/EryC1/StrS family aminotransferase [Streptomyces fulvoviolaceus]MCT9080443.1 DegT/DnrJ/EryC1/StrS family aminotransferase [Streptomyces fulvoviolaceus]